MNTSLDDKYALERGRVYLSGIQALVRLLIEQRRRDARAGLATAGFVSGYRGSPLGGFDSALWQAQRFLDEHRIRFEPGLNEEIAATAVAGSQQAGIAGSSRYRGVFGLWYAKNPGVDRAGDALKHGNAAGTAAQGGVLAVSGDDPGAVSSTLPNQCEQAFIAALMPVLEPSGIAEIIELGQLGFALSRYSGLWVGFKTVADVVESSATIEVDVERPAIVLPQDFAVPPGGLNIRWPDNRWDQDARLLQHRLPAAQAFARANRVDRVVFGRLPARLGIVCSGKASLDVRQALADLRIDAAEAAGIAVYKVGMPWPLEPQGAGEFAAQVEELLVVEERRAVLEPQLKDLAYNWPAGRRPRIVGKSDDKGAPLLPTGGELSAAIVAMAVGKRLRTLGISAHSAERLARIEALPEAPSSAGAAAAARVPHFCAGCPHARSTRVPEGSFAMAGIGCHSLRMWMPGSATLFLSQMGGEGANWIGLEPFVDARHVFQNLGDGTYCHSGTLAIRAAVAAKSNITFRVLYNEATAMTGGQPVEGAISVPRITWQLHAEGVRRIAVVSDEPEKYSGFKGFAPGVRVVSRDALEPIQRELRGEQGVTAIVYDQVCATEKRRRRRRGEAPAAAVRVFINERVCEGCGDCVEQSQCAAVMPVATPLGRKRRIDQSACNVDLSCLEGFCPSFVTLEGAQLRRPAPAAIDAPALPEPEPAPLAEPYEILINGIGGSGVITVGAILGMAAHLEGKGCTVLDNTGIARKGGAVSTHVRLAARPEDLHAPRIGQAAAGLVLACDVVTTADAQSLSRFDRARTRAIVNAHAVPTLAQRLDPDALLEAGRLREAIAAAAQGCEFVEASEIAEQLLGDSIYANMVLLGHAWQKGRVPLALQSIHAAIELNANEVESNRRAFALGRRAAHDPASIEAALAPLRDEAPAENLDAMVSHHAAFLAQYKDAAYAGRYRRLVERVRDAEARAGGDGSLALAAAQSWFRLLAIKDEYEVARLYSDGAFRREIERRFGGGYRVRYHLAPPLLARPDPATGRARKRMYGPWMGTAFRILARLRWLRGTWLDVFGYTAERRMERRLIEEYEAVIETLLAGLSTANLALAVEIAALPQKMRGFGHVKLRNVEAARRKQSELLGAFRATP